MYQVLLTIDRQQGRDILVPTIDVSCLIYSFALLRPKRNKLHLGRDTSDP